MPCHPVCGEPARGVFVSFPVTRFGVRGQAGLSVGFLSEEIPCAVPVGVATPSGVTGRSKGGDGHGAQHILVTISNTINSERRTIIRCSSSEYLQAIDVTHTARGGDQQSQAETPPRHKDAIHHTSPPTAHHDPVRLLVSSCDQTTRASLTSNPGTPHPRHFPG